MKKERKKYLYFAGFILLTFASFFFVCRGVSAGNDFFETEKEIKRLREENSKLEAEIADKMSCRKIYSELENSSYKPFTAESVLNASQVALSW